MYAGEDYRYYRKYRNKYRALTGNSLQASQYSGDYYRRGKQYKRAYRYWMRGGAHGAHGAAAAAPPAAPGAGLDLNAFLSRTYEPIEPPAEQMARLRLRPGIETFLTLKTIEFCKIYAVPGVNMSLVSPDTISVERAQQLSTTHNTNRIPIYIAGDVRNRSYRGPPAKPAFRSKDNRDKNLGSYIEMVDNEVTYSIWGNCKATTGPVGNIIDFVSIHAWGVNLESANAVDSQLILQDRHVNNGYSMTLFSNMSQRMWSSIIQAGIDSQPAAASVPKLVILTPAIGCGAYLSYLTSTYDTENPKDAALRKTLGDKYWGNPKGGLSSEDLSSLERLHTATYSYQYMELIFSALRVAVYKHAIDMKKHGVSIRVVLRTEERNTCMAFETSIGEGLTELVKRAEKLPGETLDNLFTPLECKEVSEDGTNIRADTKLGVVNAWDTFSWIGNGGSRDLSVDGFYVAGWLMGEKFVNNSYLLNSTYTHNFE